MKHRMHAPGLRGAVVRVASAVAMGVVISSVGACAASNSNSDDDGQGAFVATCTPGQQLACACPDGSSAMRACQGGAFGACACAVDVAPPPQTPTTTTQLQPVMPEPVMPEPVMPEPSPVVPPEPVAGAGGEEPASAGDGTREALRQLCVDTINNYRASLSLPPLARATSDQEACSDRGAESDGASGRAHASAGSCPGLGGQNTCPNWGVGGWSGNDTVEDAMLDCLQAMWDEGEPPVSREACQADYSGCFLQHGHFLNMSNTRYGVVSCGFNETSPGRWWMNQDFGF